MERSIPRTRIGNACPIARMATKEKPDMRFSAVDVVAKRGALTLKNAIVRAKKRMRAADVGRMLTSSNRQKEKRAAAQGCGRVW
jgi:hypothetical protein